MHLWIQGPFPIERQMLALNQHSAMEVQDTQHPESDCFLKIANYHGMIMSSEQQTFQGIQTNSMRKWQHHGQHHKHRHVS